MASSIRTRALRSAVRVAGVIYIPFLFAFYFLLFLLENFGLQVLPSAGNSYNNLSSLFWHAVELAVAVAIGMGLQSYFAFRNLYDPDYSPISRYDQGAYIEMRLPYHRAFDSCLASLNSLGKSAILLEDRRNGRIEAAVMPAKWWEYYWKSIGHRVSFRLGSDQEGSTKILVTSREPLSFTAYAGANKRIVESITAFLRQEVEQ